MIYKYGKSFADIKSHKQKFFDDNEKLLKVQNDCAEVYAKQPKRHHCKICGESFDSGMTYKSHGVDYVICSKCGHVCGTHEETEGYSNYLYIDSDYGRYMYADEPSRERYDKRMQDIYVPKAKFMADVLEQEGLSPDQIHVLDIGAGSGYFVSACDDMHISCYGIDMSIEQVDFGNHFLHNKAGGALDVIISSDLENYIRKSSANVVAAIGVMEHVIDCHQVFQAISENKNLRYLYMSVPSFGLSNILEMITPNVYNRHLGGVHTHVFSTESIQYLCDQYGMEIIAKWQFGTDMMDFYRICVTQSTRQMGQVIHNKLYQCLDEMQLVLDKHDFCSEIHCILRKK